MVMIILLLSVICAVCLFTALVAKDDEYDTVCKIFGVPAGISLIIDAVLCPIAAVLASALAIAAFYYIKRAGERRF